MGAHDFDAEGGGRESPSPSSQSWQDDRRTLSTTPGLASEDEPDEGFKEDAKFRVDTIIGKATCEVSEDSAQMQESAIDDAETVELAGQGVPQAAPAHLAQPALPIMGTGGVPNPHRGGDIAKILKALNEPAEVQRYAERSGFGRTPGHLRQMAEELDDEQRYIISLHEPREDNSPKPLVRILHQGEKDELLQGLRLQFQQASACVLKAKPRSQDRLEFETELQRIRQDIDALSRPYIFVQVSS